MGLERCKSCGALSPPDLTWCTRCGTPFGGAGGPVQPVPSSWSQPPQQPWGWPPRTPGPWELRHQKPKARKVLGTALARVVVGLVVVALIGGAVDRFFNRDDGPAHPRQWDPKVASIAAFVEKERGLTFVRPVYVDLLTPAEYRRATAGDDGQTADVTPDDRKQADQEVARFRALGLVQGKVDLLAANREVSDTGTLAFYSPEVERVIVRGTRVTPGLRVTLAHELTHALQDQHFDLKRIYKLQGVDDTLLRSVVEGDASRVEDCYVKSVLTEAERRAYSKDINAESDNAFEKLENKVPDAILTGFQVPYIFGPSFVDVLFETKGNSRVDAAIEQPPLDLEQLVDPLVYLAGQGPREVAAIEPPKGADVLDRGSFGSVMWFMMLSERIDPVVALGAIDGWGGDTTVTYEQAGKVCVEGSFLGDTLTDTDEMNLALAVWADAMPAGSVSVTRAAQVTFKTCDPGAAADLGVTGRSSEAIVFPEVRSQIISSSLSQGATEKQAGCYGNAVVSKLTLDQLTDPTGASARSPQFMKVVADARAACL